MLDGIEFNPLAEALCYWSGQMPVIFVSDCIGGLRIILHCSMEWSLIVTRELVGYVHIIQAQLVLPITN